MIPSDQPEICNQPEPGLVFRRYRLADGRTVETYEVPATVVRALGMRRIHDTLDAWHRGEIKREQSARLLGELTDRLALGVKPLAIADELGCSEAYVRLVRARLESAHGASERRNQHPKRIALGGREKA